MYQLGNSKDILQPTFAEHVEQLITQSYLINDPGLYKGKSGILLGLHHIALQFNEKYILKIGEAICVLQDDISENAGNTDDSFENGIFGIGWAVNRLYKNNYIRENEAEAMGSFDDELYKLVMYQKAGSHDLENGTMGRIVYYLDRINEELRLGNKYRYVCNYECLMLLVDDFTTQNNKFISDIESDVRILVNQGRFYSKIFNLLSILIERRIHIEITERQQVQLLRAFFDYFNYIVHQQSFAYNNKELLYNTISILNCLLKVSKSNKIACERLSSKQRFFQEVTDRWNYSFRDVQELSTQICFFKLLDIPLPQQKIRDLVYRHLWNDNTNFGLNGYSGFLLMADDDAYASEVINSAFLI